MTCGYIGIGSNTGRDAHIGRGLAALSRLFGEITLSSLYESEPVGFTGPPFYNLVAGFSAELEVRRLWQLLRDIETANGRAANSAKFTARTLDLDLLTYGDLAINDGKLQLPRPDIDRYGFVLEPLAEIAADQRHPVHGLSYGELWRRMDKSHIRQRRLDPRPLLALAPASGGHYRLPKAANDCPGQPHPST